MPTLAPGDRAPAFTLNDQDGNKVKLSDYKGQKVVVYFYPKADTPGCTTQSCELRDAEPSFDNMEAKVIGISPDPSDRVIDGNARNRRTMPPGGIDGP